MILVFIQARMSSNRFPGKVLAPLKGKPIIAHVVASLEEYIPLKQIVVATSKHPSDDPLALYAQALGVNVFRGALENVFGRFRACLEAFPCEWFFRISADSPLLKGSIVKEMLRYATSDADLVTNVQIRTFARGHSVEMLKSEPFCAIDMQHLATNEQEHLTQVYYANPHKFKIINLHSGEPSLAMLNYCVDTLDDLKRLEQILNDEPNRIPRSPIDRILSNQI